MTNAFEDTKPLYRQFENALNKAAKKHGRKWAESFREKWGGKGELFPSSNLQPALAELAQHGIFADTLDSIPTIDARAVMANWNAKAKKP